MKFRRIKTSFSLTSRVEKGLKAERRRRRYAKTFSSAVFEHTTAVYREGGWEAKKKSLEGRNFISRAKRERGGGRKSLMEKVCSMKGGERSSVNFPARVSSHGRERSSFVRPYNVYEHIVYCCYSRWRRTNVERSASLKPSSPRDLWRAADTPTFSFPCSPFFFVYYKVILFLPPSPSLRPTWQGQ